MIHLFFRGYLPFNDTSYNTPYQIVDVYVSVGYLFLGQIGRGQNLQTSERGEQEVSAFSCHILISVHVSMTPIMIADYDRWKLSTPEYQIFWSVQQYLLGKKWKST